MKKTHYLGVSHTTTYQKAQVSNPETLEVANKKCVELQQSTINNQVCYSWIK